MPGLALLSVDIAPCLPGSLWAQAVPHSEEGPQLPPSPWTPPDSGCLSPGQGGGGVSEEAPGVSITLCDFGRLCPACTSSEDGLLRIEFQEQFARHLRNPCSFKSQLATQ